MIGQTLAHYEILSALGKGGMGEVWRARDTKLGREVAIKTLPEEFARDADRLARFEREAKLLAALNHPNIAAIYGLEEDKGTHFLVLELVEGDTLADRIGRGAVSVEDALPLALQIAEALEAAHDKGVIHRDLKPANIKVTPEGKVKVLDFGLAKAFSNDGGNASVSQSPTISMAATQQGMILGTAAYMSPEQARGHEVDKRTDIWAFGCVLFEMLTGTQTFPGNDVTDILAAVVRAEPEWGSLPADVNPKLNELIARCLEKNARNRWHDIADVRVDIEAVQAHPDAAGVEQAVVSDSRRALAWAVAFVFGILLAGVAAWTLAPETVTTSRTARFSFDVPATTNQGLINTITGFVAISPDGQRIAYMESEPGDPASGSYEAVRRIGIRELDESEGRLVAGTEGAKTCFFLRTGPRWGSLPTACSDGYPFWEAPPWISSMPSRSSEPNGPKTTRSFTVAG
jgi:hypothetical protein